MLLGVTGSGKTFTMAKVIEAVQKPTLILAPNKTLAAQLYGEMKSFFPDNAVEYFVQLLRLLPARGLRPAHRHLYRERRPDQRTDRPHAPRRHAGAAGAQRCRDRRIGVLHLRYRLGRDLREDGGEAGDRRPIDRDTLARALVDLQYRRNDTSFQRGNFRLRGEIVDIFPSHYEDRAWRITLFGDEIESIHEFDPLTGEKAAELNEITVYANSHYVTPRPTLAQAIRDIKVELKQRLEELTAEGKLLEVERLTQRTTFDIEMMETTGSCKGIENYSRYLTGRKPGDPPPTLFEYLPENALLIVDESHVTVPQLGGMYRGDFNRKTILSEFGFRLPSCIDNRPLKFEEWERFRPQTDLRLRHARPVGDGAHRRRVRRAGHPSDRPDRSGHRSAAGRASGRRPARRMPRRRRAGRRACWSPR